MHHDHDDDHRHCCDAHDASRDCAREYHDVLHDVHARGCRDVRNLLDLDVPGRPQVRNDCVLPRSSDGSGDDRSDWLFGAGSRLLPGLDCGQTVHVIVLRDLELLSVTEKNGKKTLSIVLGCLFF